MKNRYRLIRVGKILLLFLAVVAIGLFLFASITTPVTNNIDSFVYNLPYKAETKHQVVQGYGGLFSHRNIAALDFEMPNGTPVYAARGGVVYAYKDDSDEGGLSSKYKKKANYVIIKHNDGSFGCYWHLQRNSVVIKRGQVLKGQQIARSGATGQVIRPHLHFSVKRILNYNKDSFIRTKFKTNKGILILKNRETYERPLD